MPMQIKDVLKTLCKSEPQLLKKNGAINQNAVARATGINQTTIKRILDGESCQPKDSNIRKIADYFSITMSQARGDVRLPARFFNQFDPYDFGAPTHPTHHVRNTHEMIKNYNPHSDSHEVVVDEKQMTSAIRKIYQVIMKNSDKIDKETAEDIMDFINFKMFQVDKKG